MQSRFNIMMFILFFSLKFSYINTNSFLQNNEEAISIYMKSKEEIENLSGLVDNVQKRNDISDEEKNNWIFSIKNEIQTQNNKTETTIMQLISSKIETLDNLKELLVLDNNSFILGGTDITKYIINDDNTKAKDIFTFESEKIKFYILNVQKCIETFSKINISDYKKMLESEERLESLEKELSLLDEKNPEYQILINDYEKVKQRLSFTKNNFFNSFKNKTKTIINYLFQKEIFIVLQKGSLIMNENVKLEDITEKVEVKLSEKISSLEIGNEKNIESPEIMVADLEKIMKLGKTPSTKKNEISEFEKNQTQKIREKYSQKEESENIRKMIFEVEMKKNEMKEKNKNQTVNIIKSQTKKIFPNVKIILNSETNSAVFHSSKKIDCTNELIQF